MHDVPGPDVRAVRAVGGWAPWSIGRSSWRWRSAFSVLAGSAALAERRVALVVGNANYDRGGVLWNTINDANAIAAVLSNAGFDVVDKRTNLGVVEFKRAVREFVDRSANADVAVVYYSGPRIGGRRWQLPDPGRRQTDELARRGRRGGFARSASGRDAAGQETEPDHPGCLSRKSLSPRERKVRVTHAASGGLAGVTPTVADTLVAFAAKAGSVSYDGDGPNSPFTAALVKYIAAAGP